MDECGSLAARNLSMFANGSSEESGPVGSVLVEEIAELLCPNDCSSNGKCVNGSCVCNKDFTADDCSASIYQIPTILRYTKIKSVTYENVKGARCQSLLRTD